MTFQQRAEAIETSLRYAADDLQAELGEAVMDADSMHNALIHAESAVSRLRQLVRDVKAESKAAA